ncbi:MAG TPA: arsenate reductase [Herbaspirillum sp.]|nr:arsenate reductase [Herbaspirillum sp.]
MTMPISITERAITVCGIPNCSTVKNARVWLDRHAIAYTFHDFKKAGVDAALVASWLPHLSLEVLINRKGTTWRALSDAQKASVADRQQAIALMMAQPSLIKRPVLMVEGKAYVGFTDAAYQQIFKISGAQA